jgi:hypothetical protein
MEYGRLSSGASFCICMEQLHLMDYSCFSSLFHSTEIQLSSSLCLFSRRFGSSALPFLHEALNTINCAMAFLHLTLQSVQLKITDSIL